MSFKFLASLTINDRTKSLLEQYQIGSVPCPLLNYPNCYQLIASSKAQATAFVKDLEQCDDCTASLMVSLLAHRFIEQL